MTPSGKRRSERAARSEPQQGPKRIVPLHGARAQAAPGTARLTYRGGPLLTSVEVVTAFWGSAWGSPPNAATAQRLNDFFKFVVASEYVGQLAEYSTPEHVIGPGRLVASAAVTDTEPDATVSDAAVQQMIDAHVGSRALPAATANTLYFALLPPGVVVQAGSDQSCHVFCGYHDRSAGGLYYAVVPYPDCAGCRGGLAAFDALTSVCSHELAEAITDPVPGLGWYDDANGENADICAWQNKQLGGFEVQLLWSNHAGACV
jgi:hypothetical protein